MHRICSRLPLGIALLVALFTAPGCGIQLSHVPVDAAPLPAAAAPLPRPVQPALPRTPEPFCSNSGRPALWAQEVMDVDLARQELGTESFLSRRTRIAVIEDAVAETSAGGFVRVSKERGDADAPSTARDVDGHGTAVVGLIAAPAPLGGAAGLEVRVLERPVVASGTNGHSYAAAREACERGYRVINMSRGSINVDGYMQSELLLPQLELLAQSGCLVVQAAGNMGTQKPFTEDQLDDAQLTVAAVGLAGDRLADSSVWGEVAAPGQGVLVVESGEVAEKASSFDRCGGEDSPFVFRDGTSYAAPLVAAVAGEVLGFLEDEGSFQKLPPARQVKLLNRIVRASMQAGSVNSLRAVAIARRWITRPEWPMGVVRLAAMLQEQPDGACTETAECEPGVDGCLQQFRRRSALCDNVTPGERRRAALQWITQGRLELAAKQLLLLHQQGFVADKQFSGQVVAGVRAWSGRKRHKPDYDVTRILQFKGLLDRLWHGSHAEWEGELRQDVTAAFRSRVTGKPEAFDEANRLTLAILEGGLMSPRLVADLALAHLEVPAFEGFANAFATSHAAAGDDTGVALIRLFSDPALGIRRFQRLLEGLNMLRGEIPNLPRVYDAVLESPAFAAARASEPMGPAFVWFQDNGGPEDKQAFLLRVLAAPGIGREFLGSIVGAVSWCSPPGEMARPFCSLQGLEPVLETLVTHPAFDPQQWESVTATVEKLLGGPEPSRERLIRVLDALEAQVAELPRMSSGRARTRIDLLRNREEPPSAPSR